MLSRTSVTGRGTTAGAAAGDTAVSAETERLKTEQVAAGTVQLGTQDDASVPALLTEHTWY